MASTDGTGAGAAAGAAAGVSGVAPGTTSASESPGSSGSPGADVSGAAPGARAGAPFTDEQRRYLERLFAGALRRRQSPAEQGAAETPLVHGVPAADGAPAVDELSREERIKHERNPLDIWDTVLANAARERFPEADDVFRYKFHGLFHTAPAQDAYMCRLRVPANQINSGQLRGLAALAAEYAGGYADLTTRGNLQLREVGARHAPDLLMGLYDLGLTARGAGADNIRNVTATPTSGFDPRELCDVRPQARALHHYILHSRDLYGLPRKFNVAFDSGGQVSVAGATNDIGLRAVRVPEQAAKAGGEPAAEPSASAGAEAGAGLAPGVYFRMLLGGITGHGSFGRDAGIVVPAEECVAVVAAMLRVFAAAGDRTNRKRARLKYVLERWGIERFVAETEALLGTALRRLPLQQCAAAAPVVRGAHVGVHRQRQPEFNWVGVGVPGGRLSGASMAALADLAERFGAGELRLTVFQNALIPHVADRDTAALVAALEQVGLSAAPSSYAAGTVACTGNAGCKFAMTDTKGAAVTLARHLERSAPLDGPINIHITGCPNSCAQHYCGDIGLLGVGGGTTQDGEAVEAYNVLFGGGMDQEQALAEEAYRAVPVAQLPALLTRVLRVYQSHRLAGESFNEFIRRQGVAAVTRLAGEAGATGTAAVTAARAAGRLGGEPEISALAPAMDASGARRLAGEAGAAGRLAGGPEISAVAPAVDARGARPLAESAAAGAAEGLALAAASPAASNTAATATAARTPGASIHGT